MAINFELITHNMLAVTASIVFCGIAFFTYINNPRKTSSIAISLTLLSTTVFFASHVIGVNIADPKLSRDILMFNLSLFFISAFLLHAVFKLIGKEKENSLLIWFVYTAAAALVAYFIVFPYQFLLPSVPKMYFPSYYNPGPLNITRLVFMYGIVVPYAIYLMAAAYRRATSLIERSQYKYFIITTLVAFGFGIIPNLLVYNIQADPSWGMLAFVFCVPFMYGSLQYGMFNVKIIAKQAFLYSVAIAIVGGIITLLDYSNSLLVVAYPGFPVWITALVSAALGVTASVVVWRHLRQGDMLKYEFITTVTHKFRTPLTHIKWAAETLTKPLSDSDRSIQLKYIQSANAKLVELTNLIVNASGDEDKAFDYHLEKNNISTLAKECLASLFDHLASKNIDLIKNLYPEALTVCDASRIKFVIQTLIENAIQYTADRGTMTVSSSLRDGNVIFSVSDSGIGITKEEIGMLFSKFYRGKQARLTDTEGMGIGLFMSKEIIKRHKGKIWAESEGRSKGSTFSFSLPFAR